MPDRAIETLDIGILLGFSRLDICNGNAAFLCPFHQQPTDIFRAVVHTYDVGFTTPFQDPVITYNIFRTFAFEPVSFKMHEGRFEDGRRYGRSSDGQCHSDR